MIRIVKDMGEPEEWPLSCYICMHDSYLALSFPFALPPPIQKTPQCHVPQSPDLATFSWDAGCKLQSLNPGGFNTMGNIIPILPVHS